MANVKITDMTAGSTPLAGTELFECVQSGNTRKVEASDIGYALTTDAANIIPVANGGSGAATLTGHISGNGTSAFTASPTIPFADLAGRAYAQFYSGADQTGDIATGTAVLFESTGTTGAGVTVTNNGSGNPTRVTLAAAGTYLANVMLNVANSDASTQDITVWLRKNGTDITASAVKTVIAATGSGGRGLVNISWMEVVTAAQYLEVIWLPENVAVTLDFVSAAVGPPAIAAIASATISVQRIA